jgi:hypothetical protein
MVCKCMWSYGHGEGGGVELLLGGPLLAEGTQRPQARKPTHT